MASQERGFCAVHLRVRSGLLKVSYNCCYRCEEEFRLKMKLGGNSSSKVCVDQSLIMNDSPRATVQTLRDVLPYLRVVSSSKKEFQLIKRIENHVIGLYYLLPHNTEYGVEVRNPFFARAMCKITIDGHVMGTWALKQGQVAVIERPASVAKKFTFLRTRLALLADEAHALLKMVETSPS